LIVFSRGNPELAPDNVAFAAYLFLWGLFTFIMFFGTLKTNKGLQTVFSTLFVLFFLLTIAQFVPMILPFAAIEGIICGSSAFYLSLAEMLNEAYKRPVLPIGPAKS
jgi:hypothetical protein